MKEKLVISLILVLIIFSIIMSSIALYKVKSLSEMKTSPYSIGAKSKIIIADQSYDKNNNIFQRTYFDIESEMSIIYTFFWEKNNDESYILKDIDINTISKNGLVKALKD